MLLLTGSPSCTEYTRHLQVLAIKKVLRAPAARPEAGRASRLTWAQEGRKVQTDRPCCSQGQTLKVRPGAPQTGQGRPDPRHQTLAEDTGLLQGRAPHTAHTLLTHRENKGGRLAAGSLDPSLGTSRPSALGSTRAARLPWGQRQVAPPAKPDSGLHLGGCGQ